MDVVLWVGGKFSFRRRPGLDDSHHLSLCDGGTLACNPDYSRGGNWRTVNLVGTGGQLTWNVLKVTFGSTVLSLNSFFFFYAPSDSRRSLCRISPSFFPNFTFNSTL